MEIYGSDGRSGILQLSQEETGSIDVFFSRGNSTMFVLYVNKSLGVIREVKIGNKHTNSAII